MRQAAVLVAAVVLAACTPCRTFSEKSSQCDDLADGLNVDSAEAVCKQIEPADFGWSQDEWECMLTCVGTAATCTQYFERAYLTCDCNDECGLVCSE
jgi:hypothetical protein